MFTPQPRDEGVPQPRGVHGIALNALPPHAGELLRLLRDCGANHAVLFGGAVRDADLAVAHGRAIAINDYDLRVTTVADDLPAAAAAVIRRLECRLGARAESLVVYGPGKQRYGFTLPQMSLDISFRATLHSAALMSARSDVGISAVALDDTMQAWATESYLNDRAERTISVLPCGHWERSLAYAERLRAQKFPDHTIVDAVTRTPIASAAPAIPAF